MVWEFENGLKMKCLREREIEIDWNGLVFIWEKGLDVGSNTYFLFFLKMIDFTLILN